MLAAGLAVEGMCYAGVIPTADRLDPAVHFTFLSATAEPRQNQNFLRIQMLSYPR